MADQTRAEHQLSNLAYLQHKVDLAAGAALLAKKALKRTTDYQDAEYAAEQLTYAKQALQLALLMLGPWQQDELPLTQPNPTFAELESQSNTFLQDVGQIAQAAADHINAGELDGPGVTMTATVGTP